MLHDFGDKMTTPEVIEKELQMKPEEFDKQFLAWLEPQTAEDRRAITMSGASASACSRGLREGKEVGRSHQGRRSHPRHVFRVRRRWAASMNFWRRPGSAKGDKAKATAELERYSKIGGRDPAIAQATVRNFLSEQGRKKEAAAVLERLNLIYLEDDEAHSRLGELSLDLGNAKIAAARVSGGAGPEAGRSGGRAPGPGAGV